VSPSGGEGYNAGLSSVDLDEYVFFDDGEAILLRRKRAKARSYVCWPWRACRRAGMRARRVEFYSFDLARVALDIANHTSDQRYLYSAEVMMKMCPSLGALGG